MGYNYTVQGWCRVERPVDLAAVRWPALAGLDEGDAPGYWARVTGRGHDHVVFATEGKHVANYYVALLTSLLSAGGSGRGVVMVTGEWKTDFKDRLIIAHDGRACTIPLVSLHDPQSPWAAVYDASHYMRPDPAETGDPDPLAAALAGRSDVHGWVKLKYDRRQEQVAAAADELVRHAPTLAGGVATMCQYGEPYVLVGQDAADPTQTAAAMAALTTAEPESYGLLYCGTPADGGRSQVPVMVEAGRVTVLPAVSISPADEADPGPADVDAYGGLSHGFSAVPVRSAASLDGLYAVARRALAVDGDDHWRPVTAVGGPGYHLTVGDLTLVLTANAGQAHVIPPDEWPLLLIAFARYTADPAALSGRVRDVVGRLRAAGGNALTVGLDHARPNPL